ncbi:MAG: excalibur calcium-binding domain-containing protein, partial [Caulobacteraceae bacterium]
GAVVLGGLTYDYGLDWGPELISAAPPEVTGLLGAVETPAWLRPAPAVDHHFQGCDDARAIGMENIPASDPSYRAFMEGDGDGLSLRS